VELEGSTPFLQGRVERKDGGCRIVSILALRRSLAVDVLHILLEWSAATLSEHGPLDKRAEACRVIVIYVYNSYNMLF